MDFDPSTYLLVSKFARLWWYFFFERDDKFIWRVLLDLNLRREYISSKKKKSKRIFRIALIIVHKQPNQLNPQIGSAINPYQSWKTAWIALDIS